MEPILTGKSELYDVVVIGGGHAGCEAAAAAARMGAKTILLTFDPDRVAYMSCNPAIGGVAKGQLVREIDALGGLIARVTDRCAIHYRMLNTSRGPAVHSPRAQCERQAYPGVMKSLLDALPYLTVAKGEGVALIERDGKLAGVADRNGNVIPARAAVIASGTFLGGLMHCGEKQTVGGRVGEPASVQLAAHLEERGFDLLRLKTGTPARLARHSIDMESLEKQTGDEPPRRFSFEPGGPTPENRVACRMTRTGVETHDIIRSGLDRSPLYGGAIKGIGPRYCPSIEDKVVKFPDRDSHLIFLEPEGVEEDVVYPNGISTSLPIDIQERFIRTIPGLERVEILLPGYAIEYFASNPMDMTAWLESKRLPGLFLAGQINGTSGYEEAAAQGLVAGINAVLRQRGEEPFVPTREESYIGVMVDDLVTKGVTEPYRLFTSSAEHRLLLRQDNADLRLTPHAARLGLVSQDRLSEVERIERETRAIVQVLQNHSLGPTDSVNDRLRNMGLEPVTRPVTLEALLRRPGVDLSHVRAMGVEIPPARPRVREQVEIEVTYAFYVERHRKQVDAQRHYNSVRLPEELDYASLPGLRRETVDKLSRIRPTSLGQAARVSGVRPADLAILYTFAQNRIERTEP